MNPIDPLQSLQQKAAEVLAPPARPARPARQATVQPEERPLPEVQDWSGALLDQAPDAWLAFDRHGRQLHANPVARHWLGQNAVVGLLPAERLSLQDVLLLRKPHHEVLRSGQPHCMLYDIAHHGGARRIRASSFPLRGADGQIVGVGCCWQDVTAEIPPRGMAQLSEQIFLHSQSPLMLLDGERRIQRVNTAFERQSGFSSASVVGRSVDLLRSNEHELAFYEAIWAAVERNGAWAGELVSRRADGRHLVCWVNIDTLRLQDGRFQGYLVSMTDLTELRRATDEAARLANFDPLTGLPNRALFQDRLRQRLLQSKHRLQSGALLFIDLDHFKEVNDSQGHQVGDELLLLIAHRLRDSVREQDTVARLGGDEFVALLPDIDRAKALELSQRLLRHLHAPLALDGLFGYRPQASIGLAMFPEDGDELETLMRHADQAMYAAKRAGRNQLAIFNPELSASSRHSFDLHLELRQALGQGQLRLHLQPTFRLHDLSPVGAEILVRWQHPRRGLLTPSCFMAVAEQHQILADIDTWVLRTALRQLAQWRAQGRWPSGWRLALNLRIDALLRPEWVGQLLVELRQLDLSPDCLEFELSESVWVRPEPQVLAALEQLHAQGIVLAIDDFGTGYSSLAYLKHLPARVVKIDQGFVRGLHEHPKDRLLVEAVVMLAERFELDAVAEGVETESQRQLLLQMGCTLGQGYLLSPPLPLGEFAARFLGA